MKSFLQKHTDKIVGVLSGFDRLVFRGTLRRLAYLAGMKSYLWKRQVLLKDFVAHAKDVTQDVIESSEHEAKRLGRTVQFLQSSRTNKEKVALEIAERDGVTEGLISGPRVRRAVRDLRSPQTGHGPEPKPRYERRATSHGSDGSQRISALTRVRVLRDARSRAEGDEGNARRLRASRGLGS